jgi:hypothetical protein
MPDAVFTDFASPIARVHARAPQHVGAQVIPRSDHLRSRSPTELTLLTGGPRSTSVYRYRTAASRQHEFVHLLVNQGRREVLTILSLRAFPQVADCFAGIFSKRDFRGLIPTRRSATDRTPVNELTKIGNAYDRVAVSNKPQFSSQEARSWQ